MGRAVCVFACTIIVSGPVYVYSVYNASWACVGVDTMFCNCHISLLLFTLSELMPPDMI